MIQPVPTSAMRRRPGPSPLDPGEGDPLDEHLLGQEEDHMAPYTIPPLTTVSQTGVDMGRAAAELLLSMIDQNLHREEVSDVVLAPAPGCVPLHTAPPPPGAA
jgi:hypothetical protein